MKYIYLTLTQTLTQLSSLLFVDLITFKDILCVHTYIYYLINLNILLFINLFIYLHTKQHETRRSI